MGTTHKKNWFSGSGFPTSWNKQIDNVNVNFNNNLYIGTQDLLDWRRISNPNRRWNHDQVDADFFDTKKTEQEACRVSKQPEVVDGTNMNTW